MSPARAGRFLEHQLMAYRRSWRGSIASSFLGPLAFLASMGVGLGSYVDRHVGPAAQTLHGTRYLAFLTPGLLAATAVQVAAVESAYPIMVGFKWLRTFHAAVATPVGAADVLLGYLAWVALRLTQVTAAFLAVAALFGAVGSPAAVASVPAAVLTGLSFAAPMIAFAATRETDNAFALVLRFVVIPMFLFSGTFFPVSQLPAAVRPVAYVTPLWHGVDLCRSLALGTATPLRSLVHVAYLSALSVTGAVLAVRAFRSRLER